MDIDLNDEMRSWLNQLAIDLSIPEKDIPTQLGPAEVENRQRFYPPLAKVITKTPVDMVNFGVATNDCWALLEKFDKIRLNEFVAHPDSSNAIAGLVSAFPTSDTEAAARIDSFMDQCEDLGYRNRKSDNLNAASAALLASTLLTAAYPKRFVDFRQIRWKALAKKLNYPFLRTEKPTYGEMLVWAGRFAGEIAETETFLRHWRAGEPLWTVAGICWQENFPDKVFSLKDADRYSYEEDFEEGWEVLRLHLVRERSCILVEQAKRQWFAADPLLRCDVCGFSFVEAYGDLGKHFIEAHHTQPLSEIEPGSRNRIEDLAKVCGNCHRMLHVGQVCRTIGEVRASLRRRGE